MEILQVTWWALLVIVEFDEICLCCLGLGPCRSYNRILHYPNINALRHVNLVWPEATVQVILPLMQKVFFSLSEARCLTQKLNKIIIHIKC
jgi:hypothetical protein